MEVNVVHTMHPTSLAVSQSLIIESVISVIQFEA